MLKKNSSGLGTKDQKETSRLFTSNMTTTLQKAFSARSREESGLGKTSIRVINNFAYHSKLIDGLAHATNKQVMEEASMRTPEYD